MRIGIIARGLTKGGVTRYIENIIRVFNDNYFLEYKFFVFTDNIEYKEKYKNISIVYINKSNRIFWDYFKVLLKIIKSKPDVVIYPKNIIPFTHKLFSFKKVNIIHDLAFFDKSLNEYKILDTLYMRIFMRYSCKIADKIIAVSESTKNDIVNILKVNEDKINVIYEGVEEKFKKEENFNIIDKRLRKLNIEKPFIFYCGSLSPRKNILRVLKVFKHIRTFIPHNFYISGGQSWKDQEVIKYIKEILPERVFLLGYLSEEDLVMMYSAADLFVYPSLYEGFGLPIIEAQACGCPILTSNITSCPEIAGEGAVIINPYSEEEIKKGILSVLNNEEYRTSLVEKSLKNSKRFSWKITASKLLDELNYF